MLEANKSKWFEKVFALYNRNLLKRRFHSLKVFGLENLESKDIPTIIYANHSSWWDGLVVFQILHETKADGFVIMEEKQLKNLQLFRRLGAFSVVRENPREAIRSINYSVELLQENPHRTLWIFPQGEILPNDWRPFKFYNGISRIIEKVGKCQTICLTMRFEFLGEFKPEIFVRIEKPDIVKVDDSFDAKNLTNKLADNLTVSLDKLKNNILQKDLKEFKEII